MHYIDALHRSTAPEHCRPRGLAEMAGTARCVKARDAAAACGTAAPNNVGIATNPSILTRALESIAQTSHLS